MFLARVSVRLKPAVSDPQGQTIRGGLRQLGFESVGSVRAGKYLEIELDAPDEADARRQVSDMCDQLLANPIIEEYTFTLEAL